MLRLVRRSLVLLLVLAVLLTATITWIFSGRIRSAALEVRPATPSYDVRVVSASDEQVVLDDAADHRDALHEGWTYGLRWEGGSAVVGGPAEVTGDHEVTLALLDGDAPEPGTEVDVFRDLYADAADVTGLRLREESYDVGDHRFPAYVTEPRGTDVDPSEWAVLVHGKGGTPLEMARLARDLVAAGRTVMLIGYRNDADAWQDPSGHYRYGAAEWRDLHAALVWARDHGARDVVLAGASMGGAVVASYLERVEDRTGVSGVVLDSPMLDLDAVIGWGARDETLPGGLPLPGAMTWSATQLAGLRFGVDWGAVDFLDDTAWADVPVLVLHGDDDGTVPVSLSRELAEDDDVTLEEFPGAGHVESWNSDPERYDRLVTDFVAGL
jgi:alpha-beta hydrolase superfamily lysophospholipase